MAKDQNQGSAPPITGAKALGQGSAIRDPANASTEVSQNPMDNAETRSRSPPMTEAKATVSRKKAEEDASLLRHLIISLDESEKKLEEFYRKNKADDFNKTKKAMIQLNDKISEILG